MLICTCPIDEDCIAWGTNFNCLPWCDYLINDEVVHAYWIRDDEYDICSNCKNPVILNRMTPDKFCKNCGAKMDGDGNGKK